jgi:sugar-specific transcriptional regulator TrmB
LEWKLSKGVLENMTDIEKLKEDKKKALAELDDAMNACSPEYNAQIQNEQKIKIQFLSLWKDYKNNKIKEHEFLQISNKFAEILNVDKEMRNRFGKIIQPLHAKYEKICKILINLEEQS